MTEKEIKRLNRQDLLILLGDQTERANQLEARLRKAEEMLLERKLIQEECGTMAEAALKLNNIFRDADEAAGQYLAEIRAMKEKQDTLFAEAEAAAHKKEEELLSSAEEESRIRREEAELCIQNAREQAKQMIAEAEQRVLEETHRAEEIIREAEQIAIDRTKESDEIIRQAVQRAAEEDAKIDAHWAEILQRIQNMEKEYSWLHGILQNKAGNHS